jgi:hypothetical protein
MCRGKEVDDRLISSLRFGINGNDGERCGNWAITSPVIAGGTLSTNVALNEIAWPGFSRRQEMVVIGRILADEPAELWMEGMDRSDSKRGGSMANHSSDAVSANGRVIRFAGNSVERRWDGISGAENAMAADRDALLRETYRLSRDIGYAVYRQQFFNDPDAIRKWPDPVVRERELRSWWDDSPEGGFASYSESHADVNVETLTAFRDYLRSLSRQGIDVQIAYYERSSELGRSERRNDSGASGSLSPGDIAAQAERPDSAKPERGRSNGRGR